MFLLQSGLPSYAWAFIGTGIGLFLLFLFAAIGFMVWMWRKNRKRIKKDIRNVEKIIANLAGDTEEVED